MRDYGMDLRKELDQMSWRRFLVLLRHLSPYGAVAGALEQQVEETDERRQAERFFEDMSVSKRPGNN